MLQYVEAQNAQNRRPSHGRHDQRSRVTYGKDGGVHTKPCGKVKIKNQKSLGHIFSLEILRTIKSSEVNAEVKKKSLQSLVSLSLCALPLTAPHGPRRPPARVQSLNPPPSRLPDSRKPSPQLGPEGLNPTSNLKFTRQSHARVLARK